MKSKISKFISAVGFAVLAPVMSVMAQVPGNPGNSGAFGSNGIFDNFFTFLKRIMGYLFPVVTAALILLFGYQLIMFLVGSKDDVENHEKFRKRMINSFIAVLLWFILFGLINVVANAIGVNVGDTVQSSQIPSVRL
jgi:hypothetical protein